MLSARLKWASALVCLILPLGGCGNPFGGESGVLGPTGDDEIYLMRFVAPMRLDPLPAGWRHRTSLLRRAAALSLENKDGTRALRLATDDSASMLTRKANVPLDRYPRLAWRWMVDTPLHVDGDETSEDGDDHPIRLQITFKDRTGQARALQLVWGNKLETGEYRIEGFPHIVVRGGPGAVGAWHDEEIDLGALYDKLWAGTAPAQLTEIGVLADSDETEGKTVAYLAWVQSRRAPKGGVEGAPETGAPEISSPEISSPQAVVPEAVAPNGATDGAAQ